MSPPKRGTAIPAVCSVDTAGDPPYQEVSLREVQRVNRLCSERDLAVLFPTSLINAW